MVSLHNAMRVNSDSLILMTIIMTSGVASILYASPISAQISPSHQIPNTEKLAEFQSATTGFIRYVKKLILNPEDISRLTDSYVSKVKTIFDSTPTPTSVCKPSECIILNQAPLQTIIAGNLSQKAKIKFREFRMLTSQFQKDLNQALSPSNPPYIIGQLVDIYARNVKELFSS